jgi:hypothetical protein
MLILWLQSVLLVTLSVGSLTIIPKQKKVTMTTVYLSEQFQCSKITLYKQKKNVTNMTSNELEEHDTYRMKRKEN